MTWLLYCEDSKQILQHALHSFLIQKMSEVWPEKFHKYCKKSRLWHSFVEKNWGCKTHSWKMRLQGLWNLTKMLEDPYGWLLNAILQPCVTICTRLLACSKDVGSLTWKIPLSVLVMKLYMPVDVIGNLVGVNVCDPSGIMEIIKTHSSNLDYCFIAGDIVCNHFIHVCLCLLHCLQNEVLQLLLLCSKASNRSKQLAIQWIVSKSICYSIHLSLVSIWTGDDCIHWCVWIEFPSLCNPFVLDLQSYVFLHVLAHNLAFFHSLVINKMNSNPWGVQYGSELLGHFQNRRHLYCQA